MQNRCKNCGAPLDLSKITNVIECEYCHTIIEADADRKKHYDLYLKADDAWSNKNFDEAYEIYQKIVELDYTQSEAHWGIALCRYGIAYETDPVKLVKKPTCNRINRNSIKDDANYKAAIKQAGASARSVYENLAEEIDRISRDFLKIVDKEEPYDVFISYKRTDFDGMRTDDSKYAMKLYSYLVEKGYKVFFAEQTLGNVAGEKYEPYIFAALTSSKVMFLVGGRKEYVEATWVKNEWRRFLTLSAEDPQKTLIPVHIGGDIYKIFPQELLSTQGIDAMSPSFVEESLAVLQKKMKTKGTEKTGKSLQDKYATEDKVRRVVEELDCEEEIAVEALMVRQGNINETLAYIQNDKDYQKSLWVCCECGRKNTHEVCRNEDCSITKSESYSISKQREKVKKKSQEHKKAIMNKIKGVAIVMAIIALIAGLGTLFVTKVIYPNLSNKDLYTPEIIQTYSGTYDGDATAIVTITECDKSGGIKGYFEFIKDEEYGKYNITGKITKKTNNGNVEMTMTPGEWVVQPKYFDPLKEMTVKITKKYTSFSGSRNRLYLSSGEENAEYFIKTVDDLQKLSNSKGTYQLKNDIDLNGVKWTPIEGFTGMLLGNGFTIKNLTIEASSSDIGFFSTLEGYVSDINIENAKVNVSGRNENIGILCGKMEGGILSHIKVSGSVVAENSSNVGGIVGYIELQTSNGVVSSDLENKAKVSGEDYIGGIFGRIYNKTNSSSESAAMQLSAFKNSGAVSGNAYVGGLIGDCTTGTYLYVSEFINSGSIFGKTFVGGNIGHAKGYFQNATEMSYIQKSSCKAEISAEAYVGCIVGHAEGVMVNSCTNAGSTLLASKYVVSDGVKYACVGGFAGAACGANDCVNEVDINYTAGGSYVGGIIGYIELQTSNGVVSSNLENKAKVSGEDYVGGIFGKIYNKTNSSSKSAAMQLSAFKNSGAVSGKAYVGGLVGDCTTGTYLFVLEFINTGAVNGTTYVGGNIGYAKGYFYNPTENSYIQNSSCAAAISAEAFVGCIVGKAEGVVINSCTNAGSTLTATKYISADGAKYACVGGFAGVANGANDCVNEVDINYTAGGSYVGGIIGYIELQTSNGVVSSNLENRAKVSGADYVGGIFGKIYNKTNSSSKSAAMQLSAFKNSGAVSGKAYVGGLIGDCTTGTYLYVTDFLNEGVVRGNGTVGGIVGYCKGYKGSYIQDSTTTSGGLCGKTENITVN